MSETRDTRRETRSIRRCSAIAIVLAISIDAHADTLIDPTRPAFAPAKSSTTSRAIDPVSRVTAIFKAGDRRVAVIDGQVVKAGDRIGDVVIQEVLADGVRFTRGGRVEVARLPKPAMSVRRDARKPSIREESNP
jgi:hypothetical protein